MPRRLRDRRSERKGAVSQCRGQLGHRRPCRQSFRGEGEREKRAREQAGGFQAGLGRAPPS